MHRFLLVLGLLVSCERGTSPQPLPASTGSAPLVLPPRPSASVLPAPPVRPAPTALYPTALQIDQPGRRPLALTLLRTEPDVGTALLNEESGDLLVFQETTEGETIRLVAPVMTATLVLPAGKRPGSLRIQGGPTIPVHGRAPEPAPGKIGAHGSPPEDEVFLTPEGEEVKVTPSERFRFLMPQKIGRSSRPEILYHGHWLSGMNRRFKPDRVALGSRILESERLAPERSLGCLVHGVVPAMSGELGPAVKQAWQGWSRERCAEGGEGAVVELSYRVVRLAGVNLPSCEPRAVNELPPANCAEPPSGIHLPINLQARVSTAAGIVRVEEAFLLDTKAGTVERLTPLATPPMATVLKDWASRELVAPPWFPRETLTWPPEPPGSPGMTLTVGPSTINVVLPVAPLGLFLPSRQVEIGPRSLFVLAFKPGAATRRLTAPVLVDY